MKIRKILFLFIFVLILPLCFFACDAKKEIEIRVTGDYVQWSYVGENTWRDVIKVDEIKSILGESYKGEQGEKGDSGIDGKQVEFTHNDGYVDWRYIGENTWHHLISVDELKTNVTQESNPQQLAFYPLDDGTYGVGEGNATQLSEIVIPETFLGKSVTRIVESGFYHCKNLQNIIIPDTITSIGNQAFSCSNKLRTICIPASVEEMGRWVFSNFDNDLELKFAGTILQWCKINFVDGVMVDGYYYLFVENQQEPLSAITAGDLHGLTEIKANTFARVQSLQSIELPNTVTSIGTYAFQYCAGLASIVIPNSVTTISSGTFQYCTGLTSIIVPSSVTSIGTYAFQYCAGLASIVIPNSVTTISSGTFLYCTGLTSIIVPSSVISIGNEAFSGCSGLTSIIFNENSQLTSIGSYAFAFCSELTSITIPNSVVKICNFALYWCNSLVEIVFENPNGWIVDSTHISSEVLSDSSRAADYYMYTKSYDWIREL